jgi:hypothetical protein
MCFWNLRKAANSPAVTHAYISMIILGSCCPYIISVASLPDLFNKWSQTVDKGCHPTLAVVVRNVTRKFSAPLKWTTQILGLYLRSAGSNPGWVTMFRCEFIRCSSIHPYGCRDTMLNRPRPLPSKSFTSSLFAIFPRCYIKWTANTISKQTKSEDLSLLRYNAA